jgi:prevent-host-death family protein
MQVSITEAKADFSKLVRRAAAGDEIVITKAGKPMVVLQPYPAAEKPIRRPGGWKGKVWIKGSFDSADKEIEELFYGE